MAVITEFGAAVNQICSERGINPDEVYKALEEAVLAAYMKDYGEAENLRAEVDRDTGEVRIIADRTVVKGETDIPAEISLKEALKISSTLKVGDRVELEVPLEGFGRIAAQTAKQVILQKIRESEKSAIVAEFKDQIGTVVTGLVQRMMGPIAVVEVGKAVAHMPPEEQIPNEFYKIGERYKFFLKEIKNEDELIVSRGAPEFLIELFKMEVPEIESGIVEVKACAREAGSRSKMAVVSHQEGVDPIGSCVGQKGMRIANVMSELGEEKIDIIEWDESPEKFIGNALGPAQVDKVELDDTLARVTVPDDQLSLAIGKDGQNVRLAAKLTGVRIDITAPSLIASAAATAEATKGVELSKRVLNSLEKAGVSLTKLVKMKPEEIAEIKGIGKSAQDEIAAYVTAANSVNIEKPEETVEPVAKESAPEKEETVKDEEKKDEPNKEAEPEKAK